MKRSRGWRRLGRIEETDSQLKRSVDEELEHHIAYRTERLMAEGLSEAEARNSALEMFGDVQQTRRRLGRAARIGMRRLRFAEGLSNFAGDTRRAVRRLIRSPSFTLAAVLSLALGIGTNVFVFSFLNALLLRPMPVRDPSTLLSVRTSYQGGPDYGITSYPDYRDLKAQDTAFSSLAAYSYAPANLTCRQSSRVVLVQMVSWDFFRALDVEMALGRSFAPEEDATPGSHPVAILSHRAWEVYGSSDTGILGETISINGHPMTVVGIAPRTFTGLSMILRPEVWTPLMMVGQVSAYSINLEGRVDPWLYLVGRLKPGASQDEARASLDAIGSNLAETYPAWNRNKRFTAIEANRMKISPTEPTDMMIPSSVLLMLITGAVLLIACLNIANLNLAVAVRRGREIALRRSLGAGRGRIIRQLLLESILLAALAGTLGLGISAWIAPRLWAMQPYSEIPLTLDPGPDLTVLAFVILLTLLAALLFGLAPALNLFSKRRFSTLRVQSASLSGTRRTVRLQNLLVMGQIALSLLLFTATGLFVRSLQHLMAVDPGFSTRDAVVAAVNLGYGRYDQTEGAAFFDDLKERVEVLPGVRSVTIAAALPLGQVHGQHDVQIEGYQPAPEERMVFKRNMVGPDYFETMGIPIIRGRTIDGRDRADTQPVVVVNETMARRFWIDGDPIGRVLSADLQVPRVVVGVMKDGKYGSLTEPDEPYLCIPITQAPYVQRRYVVVRSEGDPVSLVEPVGAVLRDMAPDLPVPVMTMDDYLQMNAEAEKSIVILIGGFTLLALLLALVGVYGVMSYAASRRTQEFGIRVALGARRADILRNVIGRGLRVAGVGIAFGLALSVAAGYALTFFLFEVHPIEPLILVFSVGLFLIAALGASWFPAAWAARLDPMEALRVE